MLPPLPEHPDIPPAVFQQLLIDPSAADIIPVEVAVPILGAVKTGDVDNTTLPDPVVGAVII
jgi:hypothetical protein